MKMKKAISLVLACMLALMLVACGDNATSGSGSTGNGGTDNAAASIKIGVI